MNTIENRGYVYAVYYRDRFTAPDMRSEFKSLTSARIYAKRKSREYKYVSLIKESRRESTIYENYYEGKKR